MHDSNVVDLAAYRASRAVPVSDRAAQLAELATYFENQARKILGDAKTDAILNGGTPA